MRRRILDVLVAKAVVMWLLAALAGALWVDDHPHVAHLLLVGAGLTRAVALWLRTGEVHDAWARGYRTAAHDLGVGDDRVRTLRR